MPFYADYLARAASRGFQPMSEPTFAKLVAWGFNPITSEWDFRADGHDLGWDGLDRGDNGHDPEPSFLTFAQANAEAKALARQGRKFRVVRICDGCFEVVDLRPSRRVSDSRWVIDGYNVEFLGAKPPKCGEDY